MGIIGWLPSPSQAHSQRRITKNSIAEVTRTICGSFKGVKLREKSKIESKLKYDVVC